MELVIDTKALLDAEYTQLTVRFDHEEGVLWTFFDQDEIPCASTEFLSELRHHHEAIENSNGQLWKDDRYYPVRYSVMASLTPGVFNLGGQLSLFRELIRSKDKESLMHYGTECVNVLFPRINHFYLPLTTIGLVQGDALGGGFEGALTADIIIAERGTQMGFPEILFNLFPGMGAYSLLARKVGTSVAEKLVLSGKIYSAEDLHAMGVVDILADHGMGVQAVHDFVKKQERRANGFRAVQQVRQRFNPVTHDEMMDVIRIWVDAALRLTEKDLKVMDRFVRSQEKAFMKPQQQEREFLIA
ncbi:MAG: crotonase/enoyl-CoA hydratase family protein [Ferrovum sp.]|nr:crotonase/enoyl-CoA hydratase family protein [Ferrovum sp.]